MAILQEVLSALGYQPGGGSGGSGGSADTTKSLNTFDPVSAYKNHDSTLDQSYIEVTKFGAESLPALLLGHYSPVPDGSYPAQHWSSLDVYSPEELGLISPQAFRYQLLFVPYTGYSPVLLAFKEIPFWNVAMSDYYNMYIFNQDTQEFQLQYTGYVQSLATLTGFDNFLDLPEGCFSNFDIYDDEHLTTLLQAATEERDDTISTYKQYRNEEGELQYWTDDTESSYSNTVTSFPVYVYHYRKYVDTVLQNGDLCFGRDYPFECRFMATLYQEAFSRVRGSSPEELEIQIYGERVLLIDGVNIYSSVPISQEPSIINDPLSDVYILGSLVATGSNYSSSDGYTLVVNDLSSLMEDSYNEGYLLWTVYVWHNGETVLRYLSNVSFDSNTIEFEEPLPVAWRNTTDIVVRFACWNPELDCYSLEDLMLYVTERPTYDGSAIIYVYVWPDVWPSQSIQINSSAKQLTIMGVTPDMLYYNDGQLEMNIDFSNMIEDPLNMSFDYWEFVNSNAKFSYLFDPSYGFILNCSEIFMRKSTLLICGPAFVSSTFTLEDNSHLTMEEAILYNHSEEEEEYIFSIYDLSSSLTLDHVTYTSTFNRLYYNKGHVLILEPDIDAANQSISMGGTVTITAEFTSLDTEVARIKPHDGFMFISDTLNKPLWVVNGAIVGADGGTYD